MNQNLLTAFLLSALLLTIYDTRAQNIFSGERVQVVGAFNGYVTIPYGTDYRTTTYRRVSVNSGTPVDGRGQWFTTINVQNAGGNVPPINMPGGAANGFLFISGPAANRFQNKWVFSGIAQGSVNAINTISAFNSGNDMGLNMSTTGYYSFVFNDCGYTVTNARYYVGYTQSAPVTLSRSGEVLGGNGSATVSITTSATPSAGENIYVRYTLGSDFSGSGSSSIVQASGSGTSYTATIPPQTVGSMPRYYIFSSTRSLAQLNADSEADRSLSVLQYDDNGGANYTYSVALPLTFISFEGRKQGDRNWLCCKTEAESNMSHYELLRSDDGIRYEMIEQTLARNSVALTKYEWIDEHPLPGTSYYKVAAVEKDDSRSYSPILGITNTEEASLSIFPNPVAEQLSISLPTAMEGIYEMMIVNTKGQMVLRQSSTLQSNQNMTLPLNKKLAPGSYVLVLAGNGRRYTGNFIVQ